MNLYIVALYCAISLTVPCSVQSIDWHTLLERKKNVMGEEVYHVLHKQHLSFAHGEALKIADPIIKSIDIIESHEPLIDINTWCRKARVAMMPLPEYPFASSEENSGYADASKMRATVGYKLGLMIYYLDSLADQFGYEAGQIEIKVFEALRSISVQETLFRNKEQEIKTLHPSMSKEEIFSETCKWVSPPHNNVPVHATGAAVDIRLWDNKKQQYADMGMFGVIWGKNDNAPTYSSDITDEQMNNRCYMLAAAAKAGLINYVYEWWHFSSGDRYATYWQEQDKPQRKAHYGIVHQTRSKI